MVAVWGWWWYHRRYGARFKRLAAGYAERDRWPREQFDRYQDQQLASVIHAAWQSPYYSSILAEAAASALMEPREILQRLPLLSKETLRLRAKDLLTKRLLPVGTLVFRSSGTTGTPTDIYSTPEFHTHQTAVRAVRNLWWAGVEHTARRVMFGVRKVCRYDQHQPPFWRYSPAEDLAYASVYHLSPKFLPAYIAFLREFQPVSIMGYPSALNAVARYALEHRDFPPPARAIFTTSEAVRDDVREALQEVWKCRVFDHYGAVEACVFASQCEHGRYHVSPEIGLVEIVDADGRPCPPGVVGEVICTGLLNTLQPLIRYRIGDAARWSPDQSCPCGRELPMIEGIDGRFEDLCYTPDGRQMLRFDTVFKGVTRIKEAQIVQEHLDSFLVKVVPGAGFNESDIATLSENMRLHVGRCRVRVEAVAAIPRTRAGKFRAVVCKLPAAERAAVRARARKVSTTTAS
jgi:phenylacetate-CoA ligase